MLSTIRGRLDHARRHGGIVSTLGLGRIRRGFLRGWIAALLAGFSVASLAAQDVTLDIATQQKKVRSANDLTFSLLSAAPFDSSYIMVRTRRFLGRHGALVQVREQLTLEGDRSKDSAFKLEFVDVVGSAPSASATAQWTDTYRANAGLLHMHGSFLVHDPIAAAVNYRIYDFGIAQRANREVRRAVVFPIRLDKAIWVVDVDTATGTVLYSGEYDSNLTLLSEVEATSFLPVASVGKPRIQGASSNNASTASTKPPWSWRPRMNVTQFPDFAAAAASLTGSVVVQPAIAPIVSEYVQSFCQVTEDPVNGDRTLVLGYTDGIDEFFVLQTLGVADPFANNPAIQAAIEGRSHAIASYDDPAMRVYLFYESQTMFQVIGSGSLLRLKDVSMRVCRQAVTGN